MKINNEKIATTRDGITVNKENNEIYFKTITINDRDGENKNHRKRKENITVTCEDGDRITGYVAHMVEGYQCMGTHIGDWFIIKPSIHPESRQELIVEDL